MLGIPLLLHSVADTEAPSLLRQTAIVLVRCADVEQLEFHALQGLYSAVYEQPLKTAVVSLSVEGIPLLLHSAADTEVPSLLRQTLRVLVLVAFAEQVEL